ncbi:MAG: hypothetical protein AAFY57_18325 [Cyanobacteria bacterium J06642_2]
MATKTPPPPKRSKGKGEPPIAITNKKGEPPAQTETRDNLEKPEPGKPVDMNFKVPSEFKRDFKIAATMRGISQKELLMKIFNEWAERNG